MNARRSIVYFAYLGDEATDDALVEQRLAFMREQLRWLAELAARSRPTVERLVPYVAPRRWDAEVARAVSDHGFRVDPASIPADRRNRFEYPGFVALKALAARSAPDDLLFYCHSKGIVTLDPLKLGLFRLHAEVGLTADLGRLERDPLLTRAGLFPARLGWCWYNLFWIKARHMAGRAVAESDDRYQFEALIGDRADQEGHRGVLPLIGELPFAATGIPVRPWYRAEETISPTLLETYRRYAAMTSPAGSARV